MHGSRILNYLYFLFESRVSKPDIEHKPIELRFRKRIGSFLLNWILSGKHEERFIQFMAYAGNSNSFFLHGFEQCTLCLWRCTVNFVGKNYIGKNRPANKTKLAVLIEDFGTNNIGRHQIGCELNTAVG